MVESAFVPAPHHEITQIYYFSAYAEWREAAFRRHKEFVTALESMGITPVMGNFKPRRRHCRKCGHSWVHHEEKETDVSIAIYLTMGAIKDQYDLALLLSADSDLVTAIKNLKSEFPHKRVRILFPPGSVVGSDLRQAVGGIKNCRQIKQIHIERSLLPVEIRDQSGNIVARCPREYLATLPGNE